MMGTAGQVDGLAGALLRCVDDPEQIALIQVALDRYCHRLRNRLNSMKLSLFLARRLVGDAAWTEWSRADTSYRAMEAMVEQLQAFCTPFRPALAEGDLDRWIADQLPEWRRQLAARSIRLEAEGPDEPLPGRFDWDRLAKGIDTLIADWGRLAPPDSTIRITWGRSFDRDTIRFEGDGLVSLPDGEVESLAVPLLARVLHAHRGTLTLLEDAGTIELSWPADRP